MCFWTVAGNSRVTNLKWLIAHIGCSLQSPAKWIELKHYHNATVNRNFLLVCRLINRRKSCRRWLLQYKFRKLSWYCSVQSLDWLGRWGDMRDDSAEILLHFFFSAGGPFEQFWHGQGCPLFDVVHPAFPLPTTVPWKMVLERLSWHDATSPLISSERLE